MTSVTEMGSEPAVDSLETRLRYLERLIVEKADTKIPPESVSSSITGISSNVDAALEFRGKLDGLMKLLPFVEEIAEQNPKDNEDKGKEAAVTARHDDLQEYFTLCSKVNELSSILDSKQLEKIASAKDNIDASTSTFKSLLADYLTVRKRAENLYISYNVMINELSKMLIAMDVEIRVKEEENVINPRTVMAAYHFEGQFRNLPVQDHRGVGSRYQRNQLINHAVTERQRREARRVREKNAIVLQTFFRKLIAQKELTRRASEELSRLEIAGNRAELSSSLLKYIRLTIVAFFDSTHRNVDAIVKAARLVESKKRQILDFRETDPERWNPALNSFLVTVLKTARHVSGIFNWTFTPEVANGLKSMVDVLHAFSSPSPMSVAVSSVPTSLESWLKFVAGVYECLLPWRYFELVVNLLALQREPERDIPSFAAVGWDLLCGPLFLLTRNLPVISPGLRSTIARYFITEILVESKSDLFLKDCTSQRINDVFSPSEVSSVSIFEALCAEFPAAFTLVAYKASDVHDWREFVVNFLACLGIVAPHFSQGSKSGYWLLKLLHHYMAAVHLPETLEDAWEQYRTRAIPEPYSSSASLGVKKRKVNHVKKERVKKLRELDDEFIVEGEVVSFKVAGMSEPFWTRHHTKIAVGLSNMFSSDVVVDVVLGDAESWTTDDECFVTFGWITYELLELYAWRTSPLEAMGKLHLLDHSSRISSVLQKSFNLALTMTKADERVFGGSERTSIWEAVKRGAVLSREDTLRFVPVVVCAGALNSYALRNLLKLELKENQAEEDRETLKAAVFLHHHFADMVYSFSALSVGIVKILYPANSILTGWSKRSSSGLSAFVQRQWTWAYRASISVVRSAFDHGWRLGLVANENFWVRMSQDEKLPFHSMAFDPSKFYELSFYGDEQDETAEEDLHVESRFDFLTAYLPRPSDVLGTKGTHVPIEASAFTTLLNAPFLIPFIVRVQAFMSLIAKSRVTNQGDMAAAGIGNFEITARRDRLYDDAFMALSSDDYDATEALRRRWKVTMYNQVGALEAGIDGGGIFREFLTELLKSAVNPNRGLFQHTALNTLYPNPTATMFVDYMKEQFYFVGRMLGKAVYENLLVDIAFAPFLLAQLMAVPYVPHLEDLRDLDPILHKNLESLVDNFDPKSIQELQLDFSVVDTSGGYPKVIGLGPQSLHNQPVTVKNRLRYVQEFVKYKMVDEIKLPVRCLRAGFQEIIKESWLSLFRSPMELQLVLCGDQGPVDLEDLEGNTSYSGGYTAEHPTIRTFWNVVHRFGGKDKQALLKFVTSCSRPPVLGFSELNPRFCIQHGGSEDRLPTASTCMNLLKLPEYSSTEAMREKLLYAINSSAGFELS